MPRSMNELLCALLCALTLLFSASALAEVKITQQPKDAYALLGKKATVTVEAQGDDLTYQWYYKNASGKKFAKAKFTTPTYSAKITAAVSGRQVYCVVTDKDGASVKSKTVTLKAAEDLLITAQPKDQTVTEGQKATLTVKAQGSGLTYRWWVKNPGAKTFKKTTGQKATFSVKMTASLSGRQMYCVITDAVGRTVRTDTVTLKAVPELKITRQPENAVVPKGTKATVTVAASGEGLKYQWYYKNASGKKFAKAKFTTPTYTARVTAAVSGRQIYCVITDASGKTLQSDTVTLKIIPELKIVAQPQDQAVKEGKKAVLTAQAQGEGLSYRWWVKNPGAKTFKKTTGQKATFSVKMTEKIDGRQMYCVITDQYGQSITTDTVTLTLVKTTVLDDLTWKKTDDGKGIVITEYTGSAAQVAIPDTIEGLPVVEIGNWSFEQSADLETVVLPSSVKTIGDGAFYTCSDLTSINLPAGLTSIGPMAFAGTKLASVQIPKGVKTISEYAFYQCDSLQTVSLPSGVTLIDTAAFSSCTALRTINIPSSVKEIGNSAFFCCYALETLTLPNTLTQVGVGAFYGCTSLKSIAIPDSVTLLSKEAFMECTGLESVTLPADLTYIDHKLFSGCTSLKSIIIPQSVTLFGMEAFKGCASLESINIPDKVTVLYEGTFYGCTSLKRISLPANTGFVEDDAFDNCSEDLVFENVVKNSYLHTWLKDKGMRFNLV